MGRPPLPIGERGVIRRYAVPGGFEASCRVRDRDGRTREVTARGASKQKAENALKTRLQQRFSGMADVTPETKIEKLAELWYPTVKKSPGTKDTYRLQLDAHIIPGIGGVRLREMSTGRCEDFLQSVTEKRVRTIRGRQVTRGGVSAAKSCRTVLTLMLSMAVRYDALDANPMRETTPGFTGGNKVRALSVEEFHRLRSNVIRWQGAGRMGPGRSSDLVDIVDLAIATGCRPGELMAFRWADVDQGTIEVSGTIRRTSESGLHRQAFPKSDSGHRVLVLPKFAVALLARRKLAQDPERNPLGLVFPSQVGGVVDPGNLRRQWIEARGEEFAWVHLSSLRKTVATLISDETDSVQASLQLGHASDVVTKQYYIQANRTAPDSSHLLERFGQ